jgi:hypothetical protein
MEDKGMELVVGEDRVTSGGVVRQFVRASSGIKKKRYSAGVKGFQIGGSAKDRDRCKLVVWTDRVHRVSGGDGGECYLGKRQAVFDGGRGKYDVMAKGGGGDSEGESKNINAGGAGG